MTTYLDEVRERNPDYAVAEETRIRCEVIRILPELLVATRAKPAELLPKLIDAALVTSSSSIQRDATAQQ